MKSVITLVGGTEKTFQQFQETLAILQRPILFVNIEPTILAATISNKMPEWRIQLEKTMRENPDHDIINRIDAANCDELRDFNRSVRALGIYSHHPSAFLVDETAKTHHDLKLLKHPELSYKFNCNQYSQIWPAMATQKEHLQTLSSYLSH